MCIRDRFQKAPVLGSLIDPRKDKATNYASSFQELQPLLEQALADERADDAAHELAVIAQGIAKAAELLAAQFTLIATNVPYLMRRKQGVELQRFCDAYFPRSKNDLATTFIERGFSLLSLFGTEAIVVPQNWLFLVTYQSFLLDLLRNRCINMVARLGAKGFQTPMWDFNIALFLASADQPKDCLLYTSRCV